jgi:hypothetical protein
MRGANIIRFWRLEPSLGVFIAITREGKAIVPVLEFSKIGQDGNYNAPFTYTLEYVSTRHLGRNEVPISRNQVPQTVKEYFRAFYRSREERREGVKQEEVGVA